MLRAGNKMQIVDEKHIHSIFPTFDTGDCSRLKKDISFHEHNDFFQKYIKDNKGNLGFSSKIQIKKLSEMPYEYSLYFDLNETNFYISYQNYFEEEIEKEKEIFLKTKSSFILHPDVHHNQYETYFQYLNGITIRKLIKRNQQAHIINETDKLLWCLQICYAMSDLYNESNDIHKYSFYHGNISDETFIIDSMKNVYLVNTKPNSRHQYFQNSEINNKTQNCNDISLKKKKDLYSCGILFEEILKEKLPDEETLTNRSVQWYRNHHSEFDRILNKFPNRKDIYTDFQQIIQDLKSTLVYKYKKKEIEARLNAVTDKKNCSLSNLIFSEISGICDMKHIFKELFIKLRDQTEKGSDYYLFFNLVLHAFFPTNILIERKIDYVDLLNILKQKDNLNTNIEILLNKCLPNEDELRQIKQNIINDININEQEINLFDKSKEILINELRGNDDDQKDFKKYLQNVYFYYFPCSSNKISDKEEIFDYFGIFYFLKNKNDILRLTYPTINENIIQRLNNIPNETSIKSFLTKTNSYINKFCVLDFADKFDSTHLYNRLFYSVKHSCFYLNRKFQFDEYEKFEKMVKYQDELFTKINSKYILHLDNEENNVKYGKKYSSSNIPYVPTTLLNLIRTNDQHRIINDCDKILWAIQIATAFKDLQNYQNNENFVDFNSCIYDHSFFIDSMKNIYLGTLVYCTEHEMDDAVTSGPMYFRSMNNPSYIYTYGVLLNEIITEIEPKNLFGNKSRYERMEVFKKGYYSFDKFNDVGHEWYEKYGYDIKNIVDKCIKNEIDNFEEIIELLKKTKLYKQYKYIVDKREEEAQKIEWNRKSTIKTLLFWEIAGISDMSQVFQQFIKALDENCNEFEYQSLFDTVLHEMNESNSPMNHLQAIDRFLHFLQQYV